MRQIQSLPFAVLLTLLVLSPAQAFLGFFSKIPEVKANDGLVAIPVAEVSDGQAHHFRFVQGETDIVFFVLKTPDGQIRAAFDACDVCYHAKKGYSQQGEFMVCTNCGMKFHALRIGDVEGGCNPAPLKRAVDGETVVIAASDLATGLRFFQ